MRRPSSTRPRSTSQACYHVSVPGRTELAGNHQDHQGGCVIAAGIDKRIHCDVRELEGTQVIVRSQGYETLSIDIADRDFWTSRADERQTTLSLVRGMAAQLVQHGIELRGCTLDIDSEIPAGMGLSSSAAFELCVGAALLAVAGWRMVDGTDTSGAEDMFGRQELSPMHLAQMALHAERAFFGKPCGIMDQIACAYGGVIHIDFSNRISPIINRVELPPSCDDYTYCFVKCGSGHENSTDSFAGVAQDMQSAADAFNAAQLRDLSKQEYVRNIAHVRSTCGDLIALRGLAFFNEFDLVRERLDALQADDAARFVRLSERSGIVSAEYLQNVGYPGVHEDAMLAFALCRTVLTEMSEFGRRPRGSARIHGGGFGGTIQVIVPNEDAARFEERIDQLLGTGSCIQVRLGAPGILVTES